METFFTSDTHFFHKNILKYQKVERPFDTLDDMHEGIIERWNSRVGPFDDIYHLGDVSFGSPKKLEQILSRLNGRIHLILGNHDGGIAKISADGEIRPNVYLRKYFRRIMKYHELKIANRKFVLFHFPIYSWNMIHHGVYHLYGHVHGSIPMMHGGLGMDVGVDTNQCYPYHLDELIQILDKAKEEMGNYDPRGRGEIR